MKKQHSNIDGFIPRRPKGQIDVLGDIKKSKIQPDSLNYKPINTSTEKRSRIIGQPTKGLSLDRSDINDSLNSIDNTKPVKKLSSKQRRRMAKDAKRPRSLARRIIKWIIIFIVLAVIAIGGYYFYKVAHVGNSVFNGNILEIFNTQPLKQDSNGRSNFLLLGTSEDDPGHEGATLTDSILVVSVDQTNKNMYMFSVPRDMLVEYGEACNAGYSGKINEYFNCVNSGTTKEDEQDRLAKTQKFIGSIFGIDIQYGVHVNYTVMRDVVNALGGSITVKIESSDSRGQMDGNFDWKCGANYWTRIKNCPPNGHYIDYANGEVTLDAEHALYLAQARGDTEVSYGFPLSNFDREKNQRKILVAIRDKALSTGSLTNLGTITKLIDALGDNLRTNIQTSEIRTIMQVASDIKSSDIFSLDLFGDGVMSGDGNPTAGDFQYDDIQTYLNKKLSSNPVVRESAPIVVLNGTNQTGYGQTKANELIEAGYNVALIDNAPDGTYNGVEIYQIGTDNSETAKALAKLYNVTIQTTKPPIYVNGDVRFVVIFGDTAS